MTGLPPKTPHSKALESFCEVDPAWPKRRGLGKLGIGQACDGFSEGDEWQARGVGLGVNEPIQKAWFGSGRFPGGKEGGDRDGR